MKLSLPRGSGDKGDPVSQREMVPAVGCPPRARSARQRFPPPSSGFRHRAIGWLAGCVVVGTAGLAGGCGGSATTRGEAKAGAATQVKVIELQPIDLRREVEAVGTLAARDETVVSAEVEGRV